MLELNKAKETINEVLNEKLSEVEFDCTINKDEHELIWKSESVETGDLDDEFEVSLSYSESGNLFFNISPFKVIKIQHQSLYWLNEFNRNSPFLHAYLDPSGDISEDDAYLCIGYLTIVRDETVLRKLVQLCAKALDELSESEALHHLIDLGE